MAAVQRMAQTARPRLRDPMIHRVAVALALTHYRLELWPDYPTAAQVETVAVAAAKALCHPAAYAGVACPAQVVTGQKATTAAPDSVLC